MENSILTLLKTQTRPLHDGLEARVDIVRRLQSRGSYVNLLAAFYGYYEPLERALLRVAQLPTVIVDLAARRKVALLERDLAELDVDPAKLPQCDQLPALDSCGAAVGCLYVVEGATLGGQIIE